MLSLHKALLAGADGVELDVQFNRDLEPYLLHDASLSRVAGLERSIAELSCAGLQSISVHEAQRFGEQFYPYPIEKLEAIRPLLSQFPNAHFFVEIKLESLEHISMDAALAKVSAIFRGHESQIVVISFGYELIRAARERMSNRVGWVLTNYNETSRQQAEQLSPDFLISKQRKLPDANLWLGAWQWFAYDIVTMVQYQRMERLNVQWIESWNVTGILNQPGHG